MGDVLASLEPMGLFKEEEASKRIAALLMELNNTMPQWLIKGHSPKDIIALRTGEQTERGKIVDFNAYRPKVGRNAPCPCGSGKKYKKCCLDKDLNNI